MLTIACDVTPMRFAIARCPYRGASLFQRCFGFPIKTTKPLFVVGVHARALQNHIPAAIYVLYA